MEKEKLLLDGKSLTLRQLKRYLNDEYLEVCVSEEVLLEIKKIRRKMEKWLSEDKKVIYGITTGLGKLKDYVVELEDQALFQRNILYSHAIGVGPEFDNDIIRLAMLIRVNVFCRGNSGVSPKLMERMLQFLNKGIVPRVPQIGSLGVGDLQPMAHVGLCISGYPEGKAFYKGKVGDIRSILLEAGVEPMEFELGAREALALMSGSTVLLAASVYSYFGAEKLTIAADAAAALSLEAVRGEINALDPRIHGARGIKTQIETAYNIRMLLKGSMWTTEEGRKRLGETNKRVQDAVSFRSTPQVHGAVRDVLEYISAVLSRELNASTDNPLLFSEKEELECLSGGNFHGAILAYSMDFLGIVLTDLGVISERRSARLLDPVMSYGLPSNLVGDNAGLNTGLALAQANAAALVGEMRLLASPASVGSIPSKGFQEDHNSMGMQAVRKAISIIEQLSIVLGVELMSASQAIDVISEQMKGLCLGKGSTKIYEQVRGVSETMYRDKFLVNDLNGIIKLVKSESLKSCFEEDK